MTDQIIISQVLESMKNRIINHSGLSYFKSALAYQKELIHSIIQREKDKNNVVCDLTFTKSGKQCIDMIPDDSILNSNSHDLILIAISELESNNTCAGKYPQEFVDLLLSIKPELISCE